MSSFSRKPHPGSLEYNELFVHHDELRLRKKAVESSRKRDMSLYAQRESDTDAVLKYGFLFVAHEPSRSVFQAYLHEKAPQLVMWLNRKSEYTIEEDINKIKQALQRDYVDAFPLPFWRNMSIKSLCTPFKKPVLPKLKANSKGWARRYLQWQKTLLTGILFRYFPTFLHSMEMKTHIEQCVRQLEKGSNDILLKCIIAQLEDLPFEQHIGYDTFEDSLKTVLKIQTIPIACFYSGSLEIRQQTRSFSNYFGANHKDGEKPKSLLDVIDPNIVKNHKSFIYHSLKTESNFKGKLGMKEYDRVKSREHLVDYIASVQHIRMKADDKDATFGIIMLLCAEETYNEMDIHAWNSLLSLVPKCVDVDVVKEKDAWKTTLQKVKVVMETMHESLEEIKRKTNSVNAQQCELNKETAPESIKLSTSASKESKEHSERSSKELKEDDNVRIPTECKDEEIRHGNYDKIAGQLAHETKQPKRISAEKVSEKQMPNVTAQLGGQENNSEPTYRVSNAQTSTLLLKSIGVIMKTLLNGEEATKEEAMEVIGDFLFTDKPNKLECVKKMLQEYQHATA